MIALTTVNAIVNATSTNFVTNIAKPVAIFITVPTVAAKLVTAMVIVLTAAPIVIVQVVSGDGGGDCFS